MMSLLSSVFLHFKQVLRSSGNGISLLVARGYLGGLGKRAELGREMNEPLKASLSYLNLCSMVHTIFSLQKHRPARSRATRPNRSTSPGTSGRPASGGSCAGSRRSWGTPTLTWVIPSLYVVGRITSPSSARRRGKK